jgi:tetratricopeptide (TPR) repeat protein
LSTVIYFSDNEDEITNAAAAKSLEVEGVKAAESGDLDTAIGLFTRAINIAPKWASGYNNRAQAYRLKGDTAGMRVLRPAPLMSPVCQSKASVHPVHKTAFSTTVLRPALSSPTFLFYQHVVFMCIWGGGLLSSWGVN